VYKFLAAISLIMRFAVLPNPFESFQNGIMINYLAEPFIHFITYGTVGLFYLRGSNPPAGTLLYFLFYCINIALIFVWSFLGATILAGVVIVISYILLLIWIYSRMNEY